MELNLDFGPLLDYPEYSGFVKSCEELKERIIKLSKIVDECVEIRKKHFDKLTREERIELQLFLLYARNGCYWMMLRLDGVDTTKHPIKKELNRINQTMLRWKQVKDKENRTTANKEAPKRFNISGLWESVNKRMKFEEDD